MKNIILTFTLLTILFSCKNDSKPITSTENSVVSHEKPISQKDFKEGKIEIQIYFPDNPIGTLLKKVDPTQDDIELQIATLSKALNNNDKLKIDKINKTNPLFLLQLFYVPLLKNEIFIKNNIALAKCDGLIYHLENLIKEDGTGTVFMQSQKNKNSQVSFNYSKDYIRKSTIQTIISQEQFIKEQTNETLNIAGYMCKKTIYRPKAGTHDTKAKKLEVWTSSQMPKSLNFLHPFYIEENHGIMKISVFFDENFPMVYEFKNIIAREVKDNEMTIQQHLPIYDSKTQEIEIGKKTMDIMFGGQ
ncbi:MAG: hypothetical protein ACK5MZ_01920 [Aestuariibaculum sp.]